MAAVAGAVADHLLAALCAGRTLDRAFVNDGGDIAFHLAPGATLACGLVSDLDAPGLDGRFTLSHDNKARGLATSGAGGRSFSLGIADSVTVLAENAAAADAAATLVANAVDLPGHAAIHRVPARTLDPDSDLGDRLVTRQVGRLSPPEITRALAAGRAMAARLHQAGAIHAAVLSLRGPRGQPAHPPRRRHRGHRQPVRRPLGRGPDRAGRDRRRAGRPAGCPRRRRARRGAGSDPRLRQGRDRG
jgi:ApbE superfamily uncharacterized protein (UPF0280 family)